MSALVTHEIGEGAGDVAGPGDVRAGEPDRHQCRHDNGADRAACHGLPHEPETILTRGTEHVHGEIVVQRARLMSPLDSAGPTVQYVDGGLERALLNKPTTSANWSPTCGGSARSSASCKDLGQGTLAAPGR